MFMINQILISNGHTVDVGERLIQNEMPSS